MNTREYSDYQEKYIARITGGEVQSNSGGTRFGGGDVHTKVFLIEAKTPTKHQTAFSIKEEWLRKAEEQAYEQRKEEAVVAFRFSPELNEDFYILSERQFLEYLTYKEDNDVSEV